MAVKIYGIVKETAGKMHSWVRTDAGIKRKPNSSFVFIDKGEEKLESRASLSWFQKVVQWFKKLF